MKKTQAKYSQRKLLRTEKDSLGEVRVPADALWGAQTARALENFKISGKTADPALIRAYLRIKAAAAVANESCGAIGRRERDLIVGAAVELLGSERNWREIFPVDVFQAGAGTSQNMNVNEAIAGLANRRSAGRAATRPKIHPNDHVNRSQSTNDTFPTALRLALIEVLAEVAAETEALGREFIRKGREWSRIPKSARTHLQDAVPMRFGSEIGAYGRTLLRCARWIESSRNELRELGIGGSAAGTGLTVPTGYVPAVLRELSRLTGEKLRSAPDLCEAMQSQSPVGHASATLRLLALELTRICNDLRLLASGPMTGLGELLLPEVQPGSSIMPGKVNPSIVEMANQVCFAVIGADQSVAFALQAGQLELNVMMPGMANALLDASRILTRAVHTLRTRCVAGMQPNEGRLRRHFEATPQIATALSPRLGYEATAALVKEALKTGRTVPELVLERGLLPKGELDRLIGPEARMGSAKVSKQRRK